MTALEHPLGTELHPLARRQHGMVSAVQLLGLGWTRRRIRRAVERGALIPVHRGVYAVGHLPPSPHATWMAAVLTAPGAVLSHRSAAVLHGMLRADGLPEIVCTSKSAGPAGVLRHWTRSLRPEEVTRLAGIPVTTAARTAIDLADVLPDDPWELAVRSGERRRRFDRAQLRAVRGRRGYGRMLRVIDPLRSVLEAQFADFVRRHGFPRPVVNAQLPGIGEVDAAWPALHVVVELDSWAFHGNREAFERDRARDAELAAAGWTRVRVTSRMLATDPAPLFRRLLRVA